MSYKSNQNAVHWKELRLCKFNNTGLLRDAITAGGLVIYGHRCERQYDLRSNKSTLRIGILFSLCNIETKL